MNNFIHILGLGHYIPEKVLSNSDLEKMVDTTDDWIMVRTGIKERRLASSEEGCSDLALKASKKALSEAQTDPGELTHILLATFTPDYCTPTTACVLQDKIGADHCMMAVDIAAGCSGFLYALDAARGLAQIYPKAKMLVVGSEKCTARVNFQDRNTCVLFGDGAGAAVVCPEKKKRPYVIDAHMKSDGSLGHLLPVGTEGGSVTPYNLGQVVSSEYFIQMNGRELFRLGVRGMAQLCLDILEKNQLKVEDIDLFIPHQANYRIIEALAKKLACPMDKVFVNVDRLGNTSAASVIIALSEAMEQKKIKQGDKVLLVAFGAGLTWGTTILQF